MPDYYSEPFLNLAGLTHKSALIAWGAFYFRVKESQTDFKLVDDNDLKHVHPPRHQTVGARSEPYGKAKVEVMNLAGTVVASGFTDTANHCWVSGLEPNTEYTYRVIVNDEEWANGNRRNWERVGDKMGLGPKSRPYQNRFRTHPIRRSHRLHRLPSPSSEILAWGSKRTKTEDNAKSPKRWKRLSTNLT